jgi:hypothetical protein
VGAGDELVGVGGVFGEGLGGVVARGGGGGEGGVGLEDVEAAELLVDDGEGLEALGLVDLLVEPGADFILFDLGEFLVDVVDVPGAGSVRVRAEEGERSGPVELEEGHLGKLVTFLKHNDLEGDIPSPPRILGR